MIPRIHKRGANLAGLLRYLYGPGRDEEHVNPRLIASWEGSGGPQLMEPPIAAGRRSFTRLVAIMEAPLLALENPPAAPVWHCSLRLAPGDPVLDDATWAQIVHQFMHLTGLAPHGDDEAIPWVAVRHGDDHIHIAAILARQDLRRERAGNDYLKARYAAMNLERQYVLTSTAPADRTGTRKPTAAEQRIAARTGAPTTAREQLTALVRGVAATAAGEHDFFLRLQHTGALVHLRHSVHNREQITGYAVALPTNPTANGDPVYFGGAKLAADLSLPRLRRRWQSVHDTTTPLGAHNARHADAYRQAATKIQAASAHLRASGLRYPYGASAIALAAADLLTATATQIEGQAGGPVTTAARLFDRAARELMGHVPVRRNTHVGSVRQMARLIGNMTRLANHGAGAPGQNDLAMALQLIWHLAQFAETLAEIRSAQQRRHQAEAAHLAATQLRQLATANPLGGPSDADRSPATPPTVGTPAPGATSTRTPRVPASPSQAEQSHQTAQQATTSTQPHRR